MQRVKIQEHNLDHTFTWSKPLIDVIKCNIDASTFNNNSVMGYVTCFRDSADQLLFEKSDVSHFSATVIVAESIGLIESIKMAMSSLL